MANIKTGRKISLEIWKKSLNTILEIRQGNINSVYFTINFIDAQSHAVALPAGAKPRMEFLKPDKTIVMIDGTIDPADPNAFIIELSAQCFAVAGQAIADFKVADTAGNVLVGAQLTLQIDDSSVNPAAITSVSEFVTLQNALSDVAYAAETSQQAIIRANAAMALIEPSTQASAASARAARLSETNAKASETGAAASATAAGQSKTAAEASAGKALVSETKATAAATRAETLANQMDGVGVHRYGILWDGVNAACTRMYNAVGMVAAAHLGTFDPALKNDFDRVYPWCDMKLCNWTAGTATEKAKITAFEGEPNFDLTANIGAYRPEFWYKIEQQANGGILKVVADGKLPGYIYNPAYMATAFCEGKDATGKVTCKIGDTPAYNISLNAYNTLNAANGMLTEDYWRDGAEKLLMEVEFATLNSQNATGQGFTNLRYGDDRPAFAETAANRVIFTKAVAEMYVAEKQTIGIATTWFGGFKAYYRKVLSITPHTDPLYSCVNFDGEPVNVDTTDHVGSMCAIYDNAVGRASGYVGINGKSISYYRGKALQTGAWMWIANILRDSNEKLWLAPQDTPQTGTIGADWIESGIALSRAEGYIQGLSVSKKCPLLVQPSAVGGNTTNPVGDYFYRPAVGTPTTAFASRGCLNYGSLAGASYGYWRVSPSGVYWDIAACALIVSPFGGAGVATPVKPD